MIKKINYEGKYGNQFIFSFFKILDPFIRLNNTIVDCKKGKDCSTELTKIAAGTLPEVSGMVKVASNKVQLVYFLRIFHEIECHSCIKTWQSVC